MTAQEAAGDRQETPVVRLVRTEADRAAALAVRYDVFVTEQGGKLRVVKDGALLPEPFVDLTDITNSTGERGLLGVAFDPNFSNNKYVYVYHTLKGTSMREPRNRVLRFTARDDRAVAGSKKLILKLNNLGATKTWCGTGWTGQPHKQGRHHPQEQSLL